MKNKETAYDKVFKRLMNEGCVGIAWCIKANQPFDEDKFESFKYGYLLSDNEDALASGLPHRHNLIDTYRSMDGRMDNTFVELGQEAYKIYGKTTPLLCTPSCDTCDKYEAVHSQMYCKHLMKRITAKKKACKKYIPEPIQTYLNVYYNGNIKDNQPGTEGVE